MPREIFTFKFKINIIVRQSLCFAVIVPLNNNKFDWVRLSSISEQFDWLRRVPSAFVRKNYPSYLVKYITSSF